MSKFLESMHIDRYGALFDRQVGPFGPGLNVVYGPNEAGKSSIASFTSGVLFGWEEARGVRNTYRSAAGERAGSLTFRERDQEALASGGHEGPNAGFPGEGAWPPSPDDDGWPDAGGRAWPDSPAFARSVVRRELNEDGLQGDPGIVADIDNATYQTMFSLTSDELRSLRNSSDVTARLLAAGSATGTSPSTAFVELEQRIARLTSPLSEGSVQDLERQLESKRQQVAAASDDAELLRQEDRERLELVEGLAHTSAHLDELRGRLESLRIARVQVDAVETQAEGCRRELQTLKEQRSQLDGELDLERGGREARSPLVTLDNAHERMLRDQLDEFAEEQAKSARAVELAKENSAGSAATYEALLEVDGDERAQQKRHAARVQGIALSALPLAFIVIGALTFAYGRHTSSLSFTVFGIGLIVLAFLLAVGAMAVLVRPRREEGALESRRNDARWIMLQDQKRLSASQQAKEELDSRIAAFLESEGLADAAGSIRQARALLDDAREERSRIEAAEQRASSLALRIAASEKTLEELESSRARLLEDAGLAADTTLQELDGQIRDIAAQRDAMSMAYDDMNRRWGELDQRLMQAREDRTFDQVKLEYQQLRYRLREAKRELVTLLLAKRMLEKSIAAWESRSQPEVYERASALFAELTCGKWKSMHMTAEGKMVAVSAEGEVREVRHLSLGTCQQLYLALRVAMLVHAESVGRNVPVIADDILVNFDAERRSRAALVLAKLAQKRQVIVFTCHRETVRDLRAADPGAVYLELGPDGADI